MIAEIDRYNWDAIAKDSQKEPLGNWLVWLILADRGLGKTRTGAEWVRKQVETGKRGCLALVGQDMAYVRNVMIEGESGILQCSPRHFRPKYEPSRRRLLWPNGAMATVYTASEPDLSMRGARHDGFWGEEIGTWDEYAWDVLMWGLRLGNDPRGVATATYPATKLVDKLMELPTTYVTEA